ncbi:MAG: GNAT family N-acetyltransferase [Jiangellales bacterium]
MDGRLSALRIRPATSGDDATLLALDVGDPGTGFPSVFARQRDSFFGEHEPSATLVADLDGEVVGYLTLAHPTSLPENAHVSAIHGFDVRADLRRRGIGRALLDEAARTVQAAGGSKISLGVLATNPGARSVYEKAGFVVEGVQVGEFVVDGEPVDSVMMARHL